MHILAGPGFILCWPLFSAEPGARFFAAAVPFLNLLRCSGLAGGAGVQGAPHMTVFRPGVPEAISGVFRPTRSSGSLSPRVAVKESSVMHELSSAH